MRKHIAILLVLMMGLFVLSGCSNNEKKENKDTGESKGKIVLATTTSTKDSGLLDHILPAFTEETGWEVDVVSVGSGEAMVMGENGEADVLLVHSPKAEKEFVDAGHADKDGRKDVMYNDFVVLGPKDDPAKIKKNAREDVVEAFKRISDEKKTFVSRDDESGTHKKELEIWETANIKPSGKWYIKAADGMGAVVTMTNEKLGYTLSDRATWLNVGKDTELEIVCEKDASGVLNNQYGVICVNPEKNDKIKSDGAKEFQNWITSAKTQDLIGKYGEEKYGEALFIPNAK